MNARQKCKQLKKQLAALWEDYVTSAERCGELMDATAERIEKLEASQTVCSCEKAFANSTVITEELAEEFFERLTRNPAFRRAVQFYGHTDPDTGDYILEAKLTVVMPDIEEDEDENIM